MVRAIRENVSRGCLEAEPINTVPNAHATLVPWGGEPLVRLRVDPEDTLGSWLEKSQKPSSRPWMGSCKEKALACTDTLLL